MLFPTFKYEQQKFLEGFLRVAGCDEVGIAPLAGPVVAATVILDPTSIGKQRSKTKWWYRVRDSKTTDEEERNELVAFIKDHCLDFSVGVVPHETIDEINIYQASLLAMEKSVNGLKIIPDFLFLDGIHKLPKLPNVRQQPIIDGDVKLLSISAASIVAKVARDKILHELHEIYPQFGFDKHKGYGTRFHREALLTFGITPVHRKSFGFVAECLSKFHSPKYFEKLIKIPAFAGMGFNL
ncbi:MAG: ribonuclease HII [Candidatus Doudnabacteria bacterium]|nr:ribonuclease HII [Candidatus Doudnabacteria bacterium]